MIQNMYFSDTNTVYDPRICFCAKILSLRTYSKNVYIFCKIWRVYRPLFDKLESCFFSNIRPTGINYYYPRLSSIWLHKQQKNKLYPFCGAMDKLFFLLTI